jgi:hypothetical protein
MKRRGNSAAGLSSKAQAWLAGRECAFFVFKPDDELEALWQEQGDTDSMFWHRGMSMPISLEAL